MCIRDSLQGRRRPYVVGFSTSLAHAANASFTAHSSKFRALGSRRSTPARKSAAGPRSDATSRSSGRLRGHRHSAPPAPSRFTSPRPDDRCLQRHHCHVAPGHSTACHRPPPLGRRAGWSPPSGVQPSGYRLLGVKCLGTAISCPFLPSDLCPGLLYFSASPCRSGCVTGCGVAITRAGMAAQPHGIPPLFQRPPLVVYRDSIRSMHGRFARA